MMSTVDRAGFDALSRIIMEFRSTPDRDSQLRSVLRHLKDVFHIGRHVVLHGREGMAKSLVVHRDGCMPLDCAAAVDAWTGRIADYMSCFETSEPMDHSYRWVDPAGSTCDSADPVWVQLRGHMNGAQGIGACVASRVDGHAAVTTMLQLECAETGGHARLLVSVVTAYLHSALCLQAELSHPEDVRAAVSLTTRERDILHWVFEGKTSWEIGKILCTSERTVKFHLKNVYAKLNVSNRAQAVAMLNRLRLI